MSNISGLASRISSIALIPAMPLPIIMSFFFLLTLTPYLPVFFNIPVPFDYASAGRFHATRYQSGFIRLRELLQMERAKRFG
jgi:hypothetical protein